VVTLTGSTDRRSTAQMAVDLARAIPGVLHVVDRVGYAFDDTGARPASRVRRIA
jgi:BON domain